jgi:polyisoprenoid-binding protein YceI
LARYDIVPERSSVWIEATSNVHPINTRTDGLEGFLDVVLRDGGHLDLDVSPKGELSLSVSRLSSGNVLEDRELQRRIDARRFRTIDGRLTDMRATDRDDRYLVRGDVTFRGVTNSYEQEMTVAQLDEQTLQLDGQATFDIRDFGMEPPRILMFKVRPEVDVRVEVVARKEG